MLFWQVCKSSSRATLSFPDDADVRAQNAKRTRAMESAWKGNLAKDHLLLVTASVSKDRKAYGEECDEHPLPQPLTVLERDLPLQRSLLMRKQMQRWQAMTCSAVVQTAQAAPENTSPDQRGWKACEHIAPLLPAVGELIVSEIIQVFHAGYVPPMHVGMYHGVSLMALFNPRSLDQD